MTDGQIEQVEDGGVVDVEHGGGRPASIDRTVAFCILYARCPGPDSATSRTRCPRSPRPQRPQRPHRAPEVAHWGGFALTCGAYLASSVGESLLSPVFPTAARDLGLDLTLGGVAFGVLTATIAIANIVGGNLLPRLGATRVIRLAVAFSTAGALVAATAQAFPQLALAQVLLGAGSGLYFPAGIQAVAVLAGPRRKGFAMGMFGVAFSGGLTIAAVLAPSAPPTGGGHPSPSPPASPFSPA